MRTLTLRGIDETLNAALTKASKESKTSINKTAIKLLREALGLKKKKYKILDNQDSPDNTWTGEEYEQFQETIANFGKIENELWK